MTSFKLVWQVSPWYLILCVLIAATASYALYSKKSSWSATVNYVLAGLRFIVFLLLAVLLMAPLLKIMKDYFEKPIIVLAIDNSQSLLRPKDTTYIANTKKQLAGLISQLQALPIDLKISDLQGGKVENLENLRFDQPTTNLSQLLQSIQSDYANKNLQAIMLATDGIYNQGTDPSYQATATPIYSIGLGDTVPQKDISIKSLSYNKVTFIGNKFPVVADVHYLGFKGKNISVSISQNNKILDKKIIQLQDYKGTVQVDFLIEATQKGLQHYVVQAEYLKEEFTKENNIAHAYIEVLDNKEKILIAAASPHPDIKAIRSAFEKKENYEVSVFIDGIDNYVDSQYNLIIFYQIPSVIKSNSDVFAQLLKKNTANLFVVGNQSNLNNFNALNKQITINARYGQTDNVSPAVNEKFEKFTLDVEDNKNIAAYPPMMVPYGNFSIPANANSDIIIFQKIGNSVSQKPLFYFNQVNEVKTGVILGEGLWQWRLSEMMETNDSKTFDKLISNFVQLVSSKDDKRKFRCFPSSNEYPTYESVYFETEVYNDIYERVYNNKIDLNITDENNKVIPYSFVTTPQGNKFEIRGLKQGVYKYDATTTLSGKVEKSKGEFTIQSYNLEAINNTADHEMLKLLSSKTGGSYAHQTEANSIVTLLKDKELKSVMYTTEELNEIINLPWIFLLILALISSEWFIRKYKGSY